MSGKTRDHIIVQRQTLDWGAPEYCNADAVQNFVDTFVAGRLPPDDCAREYTRTLGLLDFWDDTFSMSFAECRKRLKALAHDSWSKVRNCDRIYYEWDAPEVLDHISQRDCIVLFTDDDDWYAPDVFDVLAAHPLGDENGWIWNRTRYNGDILTSDIGDPIFTFTNNYALRSQDVGGVDTLGQSIQHTHASRMIRAGKLTFAHLHQTCLSVTNKTPCSLTTLQRAETTQTPRDALRSVLDRYQAEVGDLRPSLEWARPYLNQTREMCLDIRRNMS